MKKSNIFIIIGLLCAAAFLAVGIWVGNMGTKDPLSESESGNVISKTKAKELEERNRIEIPSEIKGKKLILSFHPLIVDPNKAYDGDKNAAAMTQNHLTSAEFQKVLQLLFDNKFVLVGLEDPRAEVNGKRTFSIVFVDHNYGPVYKANGTIDAFALENNMVVTKTAAKSQGNDEGIVILEDFLRAHPEFYAGDVALGDSKATFAFSSSQMVLGHTNRNKAFYELISALKSSGYHFAYGIDATEPKTLTINDIDLMMMEGNRAFGSNMTERAVLSGAIDLAGLTDYVYRSGIRNLYLLDQSIDKTYLGLQVTPANLQNPSNTILQKLFPLDKVADEVHQIKPVEEESAATESAA